MPYQNPDRYHESDNNAPIHFRLLCAHIVLAARVCRATPEMFQSPQGQCESYQTYSSSLDGYTSGTEAHYAKENRGDENPTTEHETQIAEGNQSGGDQ